MKIMTMNVNGLAAAWKQNLKAYVRMVDPDVCCLQEIRTDRDLERYFIPGYQECYFPSDRPGYAGVGVLVKESPLSLIKGIGVPERDKEGRAVTVETEGFYVVGVYAPAVGADLQNLDEKVAWLADLRRFLSFLSETKPVILCGDLNVGAGSLDMPRYTLGVDMPCSTPEEVEGLHSILDDGYYDVWRMANPGARGISWAPYWAKLKRITDVGWRLDYFLVAGALLSRVQDCRIMEATQMSDHRAVVLDMT